MKDILPVDKPQGISSFDVIRRLRTELGVHKMGHAGTLDPNASGLMIIGIGKSTKKLSEFTGLDKTYEAEILLGTQTTTGDPEGKIIEQKEVRVSGEDVERVIRNFTGTHQIPVPAYSAVKQDGEPLYKKARRGERVAPPIKEMVVHRAELLAYEPPVVTVRLDVSSGTYIRSLAEEFGRRLGVPAMLSNLRRTRIGDFMIENARTI